MEGEGWGGVGGGGGGRIEIMLRRELTCEGAKQC